MHRAKAIGAVGTRFWRVRTDSIQKAATRRNYRVLAGLTSDLAKAQVLGAVGAKALPHRAIYARTLPTSVIGRYLRIEKTQPEYFFLSEVRIHGKRAP